jgi:methylated-DNA-[protein]-cysteine S-methyltransferase
MEQLMKYSTLETPLGTLLIAARETGLAGVWFDAQQYFPTMVATWQRDDAHPTLRDASAQLGAYFAGDLTAFSVALAPEGTAFQQSVWRDIATVGFAKTRSYGAIAHAIDKPKASRAVGAATGRNPLSIIVPCHRIIGASGALTGYAGGMPRKVKLLALEAAVARGERYTFAKH